MSATYPRVRDACENCHSRKIRCLLEPGSIACQSCSISGSLCLFAPRAKAGRPRRTHLDNHQRRKLSSLQGIDKSSRIPDEIGHTRSSSDSLAMLGTNDLHFGPIVPFDTYWQHEKMTNNMHEFGDVEFLTNDHSTMQEEHETQTTRNETAQQCQTQQDGAVGTSTSSHPSPPPMYDISTSANETLEFDAALKLCGDLDRSYRGLRDGQTGGAEVESILKTVEYACTTARMAVSSASAERASTQALILAGMYKVFEICESLVRQMVNGNEGSRLDRLFRLKRLDFALLQGFMFLNHIGQVEAIKKISEIHTWIASILQQQEYQALW